MGPPKKHPKVLGQGVELGDEGPPQEKEASERVEGRVFQKLGVVSRHKVRPDKSGHKAQPPL